MSCFLQLVIILSLAVSLFAQKNHTIEVSNFKFVPQKITIMIGDTVTWKWVEGTHTTTSDSTTGLNVWDSPITSANRQFAIVIKSPGLHTYYCTPHKSTGMTGSIQVDNIVPVELILFRAKLDGDKVILKWETATELNNLGFDVERRIDNGGWVKLDFIRGNGTSSMRHNYSYDDSYLAQEGKYTYRLKQLDFDGSYKYYRSNSVTVKKELVYELRQNYPNPFNPETLIRIVIPVPGYVTLKVYNLLGQELSEIFAGPLDSGTHDFLFRGEEYISGIYLYIAEVSGEDGSQFIATRKMTLLK